MNEHDYAVIMAGGSGTRLWPLSRQNRPKQMLRLIGEDSLFQVAVKRLEGLFPPERICVVTVAQQVAELQVQCPAIPVENFILEPMPRGTASVVGLAAVVLQQRDPQAVMVILTADHFIRNVPLFHTLLRAAQQAALDGHLVTLGIEPTFAATGYGYIQSGENLGRYEGLDVLRALRFKEKPAEQQAQAMLNSGDHAWNSGMFVWKAGRVLEELALHMPDLTAHLKTIANAWATPQRQQVIQEAWPQLKNISIDYGIMEYASDVAVIPAAGLGWDDVGSWDALFDVLPADAQGNILSGGQHIGIDTHDSLVYIDRPQRLVVTLGVKDLVVVDTGDVLLVCHKDQAQKVRQVVEQLKRTNPEYL